MPKPKEPPLRIDVTIIYIIMGVFILLVGISTIATSGLNSPGSLVALLGLTIIAINVGLILKAYRDAGRL